MLNCSCYKPLSVAAVNSEASGVGSKAIALTSNMPCLQAQRRRVAIVSGAVGDFESRFDLFRVNLLGN